MVESSSDGILAGADTKDVAFLVVGDPFGFIIPLVLTLKLANLFNQRNNPH
jgi:hypothetical protein